ncbi:MAG: hypothetical protein QRY74_03910 [Chlamydia sp.]
MRKSIWKSSQKKSNFWLYFRIQIYSRESLIAAKIESRIVALLCYTGTSVTRSFSMYGCPGFLIPELSACPSGYYGQ